MTIQQLQYILEVTRVGTMTRSEVIQAIYDKADRPLSGRFFALSHYHPQEIYAII